MASNYFTISPTGGTGNAYLDIRASQLNNTTNDRVAVVSITNGVVTKTVTATQFGKPSITGLSFPISAPAGGSAYTFTVHTHYDVQFRNKPDWITIDDGQGNYISSAATIDKNVANGKTYNLTVDPNDTYDDRSTSFGMYHYMYNNLMPDYVSMGISQPQGAEDYITIPSSIAIDWDDNNNAKGITVRASSNQWRAEIDNTTDFTLFGGQGTISIRANNINSGTTRKTTTLSVISTKASFPYTATCVVTQYRQPTISIVDGGTVPPTGGSKTVRVVSDYYWWIQPTVMPETPTANIPYITMTGKVAGQNMSPTEGANYTLTWNSNDGNIRNDNLYVGYLKTDNSTTGRSATYANYIQNNEASETLSVSPNRIPENATSYVSSGGGTYQVVVTTGRAWQLNGTPSFCTVSPTTGNGTTTVTITVPATSLNRYRSESIYFVTNDAGQIASDSVAVYQESIYEEEPYIVVDPDYVEFITSGSNSSQFTVSANTNWSAVMEEWIHMSPTTGGTGNTSHSFSVDENSGATRDGSIDFVPLGAGTSIAFLNIRQASGTTPVVVDSISLNPSGKSIGSGTSVLNSVYVTASTAWSITSSPDWITWATTAGTAGTKTIYWNANANTGTSRTGTTTFTCGTASTTYTVEQAAAYEEPTPVGNLELDPAQISPASRSYQIYEVEVWNGTDEDYTVDYGDDWAQFYDGPYPSTADAVSMIPNGERLVLYLEVQAGQNRNMTITFTGEDSGTQVGFYVNQP